MKIIGEMGKNYLTERNIFEIKTNIKQQQSWDSPNWHCQTGMAQTTQKKNLGFSEEYYLSLC